MSQVLAHTPATPAPATPAAERAAPKRCAACDTFKPFKDFRQGNKPTADLKTCAGCRARIAQRRRERREEARSELRNLALDLAQSLIFLADNHPAYREELNRMAQRVQRRSHHAPDREVEAVTAAIRGRCHTVGDIADEKRMLPSDVTRVLHAMRAAGLVACAEVLRGGRPCELWSLVQKPTPAGDVLP